MRVFEFVGRGFEPPWGPLHERQICLPAYLLPLLRPGRLFVLFVHAYIGICMEDFGGWSAGNLEKLETTSAASHTAKGEKIEHVAELATTG